MAQQFRKPLAPPMGTVTQTPIEEDDDLLIESSPSEKFLQVTADGRLVEIDDLGNEAEVVSPKPQVTAPSAKMPQEKSPDTWLDTGLKTVGGIGGAIGGGALGLMAGGPAGAYAGGIGGSGLGEAIGGAIGDLSLDDFGEDLKSGLMWGSAGAAAGPALRLGAKAVNAVGPTLGGIVGTLAGSQAGHPWIGGSIGAGIGKAGKMVSPYISKAGDAWDNMIRKAVEGAASRLRGKTPPVGPKAAPAPGTTSTAMKPGEVPSRPLSKPDTPNLERKAPVEAVKAGEGPSGGAKGKTPVSDHHQPISQTTNTWGPQKPAASHKPNPTVEVKVAEGATVKPGKIVKQPTSQMDEADKRKVMFGGAGEGTSVKPNAKGPATFKATADARLTRSEIKKQIEAERLVQQVMKGKTGGKLTEEEFQRIVQNPELDSQIASLKKSLEKELKANRPAKTRRRDPK